MEDDETRSDAMAASRAALPADEWLGRVIDNRYRIVERLGEGGMGAVFVAEHLKLLKRVALKVIHPQFAGNNEIAARFAREAMTSAHVEHPNVASALDFGALPEGGAYLVMQLVRGPSLSDHLAQKGALPYAEACQIAAQIADAVSAAHASGIVHRDLKPDNVVLMPNDVGPPIVKVLDFGIAHVKAHNQAPEKVGHALTRVGVVIGTPGYMPPEQATGQPVDERADMYALGVILWELLSGSMPFKGGTFSEIVTRQLNDKAPELVLSSDQAIPDELRRLIGALLERTPSDRPSSASEVRDTLRTLSAQHTSMSAPRQSELPALVLDTLRAHSGPLRSAPKPVLLGLAAVALLFVFGFFRWMSAADETVAPRPASSETNAATPAPKAERQRAARAETKASEPDTARADAAKDASNDEDGDEPESKRAGTKKKAREKSDLPRPVRRLRRAIDGLLQ